MRYVSLFIILFSYGHALAQLNNKYTFKHIDQTDGLLHTNVRGLGQDERGFMWILTLNGLQRYDGSGFVDYPEINNLASFGAIHDSELYVDTALHRVMIVKSNRMVQLAKETNKMTFLSAKDFLYEDSLHQPVLFTDDSKNQWLINENGVVKYENKGPQISYSCINANSSPSKRNTSVIRDPSTGEYWAHDNIHFYITDTKSGIIHSSSDNNIEHPLLLQLSEFGGSNGIRSMLLDHDNNLWISTWTHFLHRYNTNTEKLTTYSLKDLREMQNGSETGDPAMKINAMYEDRQNNLWVATDFTGLLLYDRKKDDFSFITSDDKIPNGLRYNFSILSIFQDRDDNLWLGTDRGINIFNPYRNYIQSIRHEDGNVASLSKQEVTDVIETLQGEIIVATWGGGISIFDQQWNFLRNLQFPGSHEHNLLWSLVQNDDGTIWIGAQHGYIHIYDPVSRQIKTIQPGELSHSTITTMVRDKQGNILFGLHNGKVAIWNKRENKFYSYGETSTNIDQYPKSVLYIHIDQVNQIWVGTAAGLLEYNFQKRIYVNIFIPDNVDPVLGIMLQGIEDYNDSTLVMGAISRGIYFFNKNTKAFYRTNVNDHLNHSSVYAIKKDNEDNIWFTSNYNLFKTITDDVKQTRFNVEPSIMNAAFASNKFYELNDGRWITHSPAELICFDPKELGSFQGSKPNVQISGFKVFGKDIYIDSFLLNQKPVILAYDKNFISIEFSTPNINELRQTNYYYRLSDIDKDWIHTTTKHFADYTDLKPGEYLFEVKADNDSGNPGIASFPLIISPPWWGTVWFRLLSIVALGSLVYFILKKRIQGIRTDATLKHRVVEMEMMALRSQMNPHFIFNCINGIDAMIQSNDKYRATMYLNKFAKLIRNVLDSSHQNKVPLSKDMETLQLYVDLELFRHNGKFTATIHTEEQLLQDDYKVPPLIIQPYVENAILHGLRGRHDDKGKLNITVTKTNDHIVYTIEDNGIGRNNTNGKLNGQGKGYGMQMSNDRIRLFNNEEIASIQITDLESEGHPLGTRIQVQLKIQ